MDLFFFIRPHLIYDSIIDRHCDSLFTMESKYGEATVNLEVARRSSSPSLGAPPPPYTPSTSYPVPKGRKANLATLPLPLQFRIISLTLDPKATPSRWMSDDDEEKIRRVYGLFLGLRGVCRSFWLSEYHSYSNSRIESIRV